MEGLINIKNEQAVTTSLKIAEHFNKRHGVVLRSIESIIADSENAKLCFQKSYYKTEGNNKSYPMYYMNRDGFAFLVMGFTGRQANEWKWKYIQAFNQMEEIIRFKKTDIQLQKNSMAFLQDNLQMPTKRDFVKANTIANKCISNLNGYPKMIKKEEMNREMLEQREPILRDTVELMAVKDKYNLDIHVSESIYKKYGT